MKSVIASAALCVAATTTVTASPVDTLGRGGSLHAGDKLVASNSAAHLNVQGDGNIVLYERDGHVLWTSNTAGKGDSSTHLELQGDGNVVGYSNGHVLWSSNTNRGMRLVMQGDCNLVLYNDDSSVGWSSNTSCSSPGPAPGPGPPGPDPSSLPNVPNKPMWFGFWGSNPDVYSSSSLVWDGITEADIDQHGSPNLRFMYPAYKFFCQEQSLSGHCTLFPDYQSRWNNAVPKLVQLLKDQKILGFFAGDEMICSNKAVGPTNTMIDTIRATFSKGKAIIWINECGSTFREHSMPANADWVSLDHYRSSKDEDYIGKVKNDYDEAIFKKLHDGQRVVVIPGVGHPKDNFKICDDKCTAALELKDAKDMVEWAHDDGRIAGIMPYAWMRDGHVEFGLNQMSDNGDLLSYYQKLGRSTK